MDAKRCFCFFVFVRERTGRVWKVKLFDEDSETLLGFSAEAFEEPCEAGCFPELGSLKEYITVNVAVVDNELQVGGLKTVLCVS